MKFQDILNYSIGQFTVGKILAAVITFVVCYIAIHFLTKVFAKLIDRTGIDGTLKKYLKIAIKVIMYFIMAIIVVETLGISATSLVAAFSVVGLAASLAVQDTLANLASGVMLIVSKPFKSGDFVEIDGVSGTVAVISIVHTKIVTIDNKMIFVPNSKITSSKIVNYTAQEKRRVDIEISASYDSPVDTVRKSILKAVEDSELFIDKPQPPFAAVLSYDESSIRYVVRAWTTTKQYWDAYFALLENIKKEFDINGVEMTYNHINVHMIEK
jgi:small conductance mechanosensitive channel